MYRYDAHNAHEPDSLFWCNTVMRACAAPFPAKIGCRGFVWVVLLLIFTAQQWQASNLQRFTSSYGSRRFAACDFWTQRSWQVMQRQRDS